LDFRSAEQMSKRYTGVTEEMAQIARGLSVWATLEQAERVARRRPALVAELEIPDGDDSIEVRRTSEKDGHHTLWIVPEENQAERAAQLVRRVVRVE
jgi:hypothetical protein